MTKVIAVAGKGGTGKTTFTSLLIRHLTKKGKGSIFAIDADPNSNLNEALGLKVTKAVSDILEATKDPKAIPEGMTKHLFIEYMLSQSIIETDMVDLLVMGGPQGPGCYCYPNDILKGNMEKLSSNYDYVLVDNEAGMEHISRGTIKKIDYLFIISDASVRGIRSAGKIKELILTLKSKVNHVYLVVTKIESEDQLSELNSEIKATGLELAGYIPLDNKIIEHDIKGLPLVDLPDTSEAVNAVDNIISRIDIQ
ncbi:MAG: AAA family ATPase [Bacillota bacterium]